MGSDGSKGMALLPPLNLGSGYGLASICSEWPLQWTVTRDRRVRIKLTSPSLPMTRWIVWNGEGNARTRWVCWWKIRVAAKEKAMPGKAGFLCRASVGSAWVPWREEVVWWDIGVPRAGPLLKSPLASCSMTSTSEEVVWCRAVYKDYIRPWFDQT